MDDKKRLLIQLVANLQREDISALEECSGIRSLIEQFAYSQIQVAKLLNKSKSYISQILGLERLDPSVKERVQTSELSREIQIHASREKDPQNKWKYCKRPLKKEGLSDKYGRGKSPCKNKRNQNGHQERP